MVAGRCHPGRPPTDKLELDARVARLERRVGLLSAVILGGLAFLAVALLWAVRSSRPAMAVPPQLAAPAPAHVFPPTQPAPMMTEMGLIHGPAPQGTVADLANRLEELADLRRKGLINESEFDARKQKLLARSFVPTSLGADLEQLGELRRSEALSEADYEAFKARILDTEY